MIGSAQKSQLLSNISRFALDSRIGKALLAVKGTSIRMGERVSVKTGYSPVVMDHRYYEKGDALKDIDWKLSARTERLFVKMREGYRQTDFVIALDGSESMRASYNGNISKFITGLTLAYIIGRVGIKSRDRVYISYSGERFRADSENSLIDLLMDMESGDIADNFWDSVIESSANIFILSDFFIETDILSLFLKNILHKTKNLFLFSIHDPSEQDFDFKGRFRFLDPESDLSLLAESNDIKERYDFLYNRHFHEIARIGRSFGVNAGRISTAEDPYHAFLRAVS